MSNDNQCQAAPVAQPAQQVEAVGLEPVALRWKWKDGILDSGHPMNGWQVAKLDDHFHPSNKQHIDKELLYTAPQLEAQQAGDVALSEQAVCDMVREHGLLTDKGVRLASNGDFVSLNLTAITAIVNCVIAQGRKA